MNQTIIIGNLANDPELRTVQTQKGEVPVCSFNVAVNNRRKGTNEQQDATFFRVTAWRILGENCAKYLAKGKKVMVSGVVSARAYKNRNDEPACSLELQADDIEFLSPADRTQNSTFAAPNNAAPAPQMVVTEELPF